MHIAFKVKIVEIINHFDDNKTTAAMQRDDNSYNLLHKNLVTKKTAAFGQLNSQQIKEKKRKVIFQIFSRHSFEMNR